MTRQSPLLNFELRLEQIDDFIKECDGPFSGRLSSHHNYSRVVSLAHFVALVTMLRIIKQPHTGVISGSLSEPELRFLQSDNTTVLSFETDRAFDLDKPWFERPSQNFSMTICNQVLEHVFNPHLAFKNLIHVTRPEAISTSRFRRSIASTASLTFIPRATIRGFWKDWRWRTAWKS